MVINDVCQKLIDSYTTAIVEGTKITEVSPSLFYLTLPFNRPDGEFIEIEITTQQDGRLRLSDMGDSLGYLHINGLTTSRAILDTVRGFAQQDGLSFERYELAVSVRPEDDIGKWLHSLTQTIIRVTDLIQKRRPSERLRFNTEVEAYLIGNRIVYDGEYSVSGERESHKISFHVNNNKRALIQPMSAGTQAAAHSLAERWAYRFADILERDESWQPIVVLDDRGAKDAHWTPETIAPLKGYADTIQWSENYRLAETLIH